jgi:small redox-active disulfide protein 2
MLWNGDKNGIIYTNKLKEDFHMVIKVLGSGCANCKKLEANVREAVKELGIEATIEKVQDFKDIMAYGVMKTPALVVDEQVKVMGRVPSVEDIKKYL